MAMRFDWQTEHEEEWQDVAHARQRPLWQRMLPYLLLISLLIAALAGLLYRQARTNLAQQEADLRRTATFFFTTAVQGDAELLDSLLSGREPAWTAAIQEAAAGGRLLDRQAFDLTQRADAPQITTTSFSPDLQEGKMEVQIHYETPDGTAVTLKLPSLFRRGSRGQWLYAPPLAEFWGPTTTLTQEHLRLTLPERDAVLGAQLLADLDTAIAQLCQITTADCVPQMPLTITFSSDPATLWTLNPLAAATTITLPTPSLLGLPTDPAGYQALRNGYARQVITPLLATLSGYACCEHALYFAALARRQLMTLDLAAWPLDENDYRTLLLEDDVAFNLRVDVGWEVADLAAATPQQQREALAITEFIATSDDQVSLMAAMDALGTRGQRFTNWLQEIMALNAPLHGLGADWRPRYRGDIPGAALDSGNRYLYRFLHAQAAFPDPAPPLPLPVADILLACQAESEGVLLRYAPATNVWEEAARVPNVDLLRVVGLPGARAVWVESVVLAGNTAVTDAHLWRAGELVPVRGANALSYSGVAAPDGSQLLLRGWEGLPQPYLLNVDDCTQEACRVEPTSGPVRWSPNGRLRMQQVNEEIHVYDAAGALLTTLNGDLNAFFWLDGQTLAWVDTHGRFLRQHVDTGGNWPGVWLTLEEVAALLPPEPARGYRVVDMTPHPLDIDVVLITLLVDAIVDTFHVVAYNANQDSLTWLEALGQAALRSEAVGGPFVSGLSYEAEGKRPYLLIYDMRSAAKDTYPAHSSFNAPPQLTWHPDGAWALLSGAGYLRLLAPAQDYVQVVVPSLSTCTSAAWLQP